MNNYTIVVSQGDHENVAELSQWGKDDAVSSET